MRGWSVALYLLLFLLEGTILQLVVATGRWGVTPHLSLVLLLLLSLRQPPAWGFISGVLLGMLYDLTYGYAVGIYAFGMAWLGYWSAIAGRHFHATIFSALLVVSVGSTLYQLYLFFLYRLFGLESLSLSSALMMHMLPTLAVNVTFGLVLYLVLQRGLDSQWYRREGV